MFERPHLVIKAGTAIASDGRVLTPHTFGATHVVRPAYDPAIERRIAQFFDDYRDMRLGHFVLADGEIEDGGRGRLIVHPCRSNG
jgi:formylmethanofuran dehydrogenase subunit A